MNVPHWSWRLSLALAQAVCLDQPVLPLLRPPNRPAPLLSGYALYPYAQAYRSIVRFYYRVTHLVLWLSRHPGLTERIIHALGQEPALFQHFLSANMGLVSAWSLGPKNFFRLLRGFLA